MKAKPIITLFLAFTLAIPSVATDKAKAYNWYCKHEKCETVPNIDPNMKFIEEYGGYYVDRNANADNKTIYLTFDAGYENGNVKKVLDVLKEKNAPGAFFILENLAERNPELVARMRDEGHTVCNHTAIHRDMTSVSSKEEFTAELDRLNKAALKYANVEVEKYYRPPEGRFNEQNLKWASELGYKTVFWSYAYADWDNDHQMSPDAALKKILSGVHPGEILLLHPTSATNAAILADLIDTMRDMGYKFSSLGKLQ